MSGEQRGDFGIPTRPPDQEQRRATHCPAAQHQDLAAIRRRYGSMFTAFRVDDILNARHQTRNFKDSRASSYIATWLRFMAFFFVAAVVLYAPADYFTLTGAHVVPLPLARCALSLVHVAIGLATWRTLTILQANVLVGMEILTVALFYEAKTRGRNQVTRGKRGKSAAPAGTAPRAQAPPEDTAVYT